MQKIVAGMAILALLAGIIVAGCSGTGTEPLEETAWTLESFMDSDGSLAAVIPGSEVTIEFSADGSFSGSAGCNHYFGSYEAADGVISTGGIASTEMFCMSPEGIMTQESRYLNLLGKAASYSVEQDRLSIAGSGKETLLVFSRNA
jgi:heat shock protein HslJ